MKKELWKITKEILYRSARIFLAIALIISNLTLPVPEVIAGQPPSFYNLGPQSGKEGYQVSFYVNANDPDGGAITYGASNVPEFAEVNANHFRWIPRYNQAGEYIVTFRATDAEGLSATQDIKITVADVNTGIEGRPEYILIVINSVSEASKDVGLHYQKRRGVPDENILYINTTTDINIPYSQFYAQIRDPIRNYLETNNLKNKILYIITTYGIPYKVYADNPNYQNGDDCDSVDSVLANLYDITTDGNVRLNPYWKGTHYDSNFHDAGLHFDSSYGTYLVLRLDGPSPEIAKGLVDKSMYAEKYLGTDSQTMAYLCGLPSIAGGGIDILAQPVQKSGYAWIADPNHIGGQTPASWYASAGNDYYNVYNFYPGASGGHFQSFTARYTIRDTDTSLVVPALLAADFTGTFGAVYEPTTSGLPQPAAFFDFFLNGSPYLTKHFNFAESMYMSCPAIKWKAVILGDPLYKLSDGVTPDIEKPRIENLSCQRTGQNAVVSWDNFYSILGSPEVTRGSLDYGLTESYGQTLWDGTLLKYANDLKRNYFSQHKITLNNLDPTKRYYAQVNAIDPAGNTANQPFVIYIEGETPGPKISNVSVSNITQTSCKISWTTDVASTSQVNYGLDTNYNLVVSDSALVTTHGFDITGLTANTTYHYQILSKDALNNQSVTLDYTFTTLTNLLPQAEAGQNLTVRVGDTVTLDGSASKDSDGSIVKYEWDFETDGTYDYSGTTAITTHKYLTQGTYTATLRVIDDKGSQAIGTLTITVNPLPVPEVPPDTLKDNRNDYPNSEIPKYEKFELTFDIKWKNQDGTYTDPIAEGRINPYWPYDPNPAVNNTYPNAVPAGVGISVDGLFLPPGEIDWNKAIVQPGFYYQDYDRQIISNKDWLYPKGNPLWKIRFAPTQEGSWGYQIRVKDASGETIYDAGNFAVGVASSNKNGFVKVSSADPRYFEMSDGTFKYFFGLNDYTVMPKDMDDKYPNLGSNGVNLLRPWWQGSQGPVLFGIKGQGGFYNWHKEYPGVWSLYMDVAYGSDVTRQGELFSIPIDGTKNSGAIGTSAFVRPNTKYKFSAWVKTVALSGTGDYGAYLSVDQSTQGSGPLTSKVKGDTSWTEISAMVDTRTSQYSINLYAKIINTTSGKAYVTDMSLREDLGGGNYGQELISRPDFNVYKYISQLEAWKADYNVESAKKNGIYLKVVTEEKEDTIFGSINADGTAGPRNENNVYGTDTHACRTYQQYFWRYMIARYGYSPNIHSFELFNEGDPFNGNQYNLANAFGTYFNQNDPNKHLTTTSFWHSLPMDFWKTSSLSFIDLHEYVGDGGNRPRFYAWYDGNTGSRNLLPYSASWGTASIDQTVSHSGKNSYKIVAYDGAIDNGTNWAWGVGEYHVGIDPTHTYTLRYWARGQNVGNMGGGLAWTRPGSGGSWSKAFHENDWVGFMDTPAAALGTYEWTLFERKGIRPPVTANTANIDIHSTRKPPGGGESTLWVDDVEFIDETTGEDLFVDGGFEGARIDYDVALAVKKYGVFLHSYGQRINEPVMQGETGIVGPNIYGTPYKGYGYTGENQQLVDDNEGIHIRKLVWAHLVPKSPNMVYWWRNNISQKGLGKYFNAFQHFVSDIDFPNGKYKDAKSITSNANLRAWGQKDLVNNRAHLWIDNVLYTWKAVVDHNFNPADIAWLSTVTYAKGSLASDPANPAVVYRSLQDSNKNHLLDDTTWWENRSSDWYTLLDMKEPNPALPAPVSGTVKVSGFKDGIYNLEWWDTSTGVVTKTEEAECRNGEITLTVTDLVSDTAAKLNFNRDFDTTAPVISNITVSEITQTSCKIAWITDEPATSQVSYGLDTTYGSVTQDAALVSAHSIILSGLTTNTTYHYQLVSTDAAGNQAKSLDYTFTTLPIQYTLTITATNGAVTKEPDKTIYNAGETVTLTAVADSGYKFSNWQGDATGSVNPLSITMDANKSIEAMFVVDTSFVLISWALPTPDSGTIIKTGSQVSLNTSITYSLNTSAFFDWNSTLVEYLSFDNYTSGTQVPDVSTWANNAEIKGNPTIIDGRFGKAMQFDGVDDHLNAGNTSSLKIDDKSFTLEAWIRPASNIPTGSRFTVLSTFNPGWIMDLPDDSGVEGYRFYDGGTAYKYTPPGNLISLEWTHFAVVRDKSASSLTIYLNGTAKQSFTVTSVATSSNPLLIGRRADNNSYNFNGAMDEVRIHSRALSSQEIKSSYDAKVNGLSNTFSNITEGNYTFTAYAVNSLGNIAKTESRTVYVNNPPVANAGADQLIIIGKSITFDASASKDVGVIKLYEWDFNGDGQFEESSLSPTITHTFGEEYIGKEYSVVNLRVTDEYDVQGQDSLIIYPRAEQAPKITFISDNIVKDYPSSNGVPKYEKLELSFDVTTIALSPYWPYETNTPPSIPKGTGVTVEGVFTHVATGKIFTVPGFYYQECVRGIAGTREYVIPQGRPEWKIRFAPTEVGAWQYKIKVTDAAGTSSYPESGSVNFECVQSNNHGFVRVSTKDSRYFEFSDGTSLINLGVNDDFRDGTFAAETILRNYGENGVNILRWWMNYRGWQNPFGGGDVATANGPQWGFNLYMSTKGGAKPSDRYAAILSPGRNTRQSLYLSTGQRYRFSGYIKAENVSGSTGKGITPYIGTTQGAILTGTQDWTAFSIDFTPLTTGLYTVGVKHTGIDGTGYFDDVSVRATSDGGNTWSGEYILKGDIDFQNYIDLIEAWKVDHIFDAAKTNGVYLKTVIAENADTSLGSIGSDGTTVARSTNNFYASNNHPSRWLQKAYWRYLTARWGAYTSLHSWELCNEGDPFNGYHYNAANALATYIHSIDPNKAMSTTSFWHSIPMEFWKTSQCDYIDLHEYFGPITPGTGSHGARYYAWYDGHWNSGMESLLPIADAAGIRDFDTSIFHSGKRSYKIISHEGAVVDYNSNFVWGYEYHIGIDPSHTYTIRYWAKGENIGNMGGGLGWTRPQVGCVWSKSYHENDYIGSMAVTGDLGTYEWKFYQKTGIIPPSTANTANIHISSVRNIPGKGDGTFWIDSVEFIDETTGKNLFVDGDFEGDRIDYDTALAVKKYGVFLGSYGQRAGKSYLWAETGVRGLNIYGTPYKSSGYSDENQQLADDLDGIYIKKLVWAHAGPDNPNMMYWWTSNIEQKNLWKYFRAFREFIKDIPVSNGNYKDTLATASNPDLRALGQKDLTNNRAHLWIDNAPYIWKAVVDHSFNINDSAYTWSMAKTYSKYSIATYGSPMLVYGSLKDKPGGWMKSHNYAVGDYLIDSGKIYRANTAYTSGTTSFASEITNWELVYAGNSVPPAGNTYSGEWWQDRTGDWYLLLDMKEPNPALPAPVSGTVKVSGFKDGLYNLEWWDTSLGVVTKTEEIQCLNNNITLSVDNLESDVAVKLSYLKDFDTTPPVISNITVSEITQTSAKLTWATDEPATSQVNYGLDTSYGAVAQDVTLMTTHSIALRGLTANTTYHYQVVSADQAENQAKSLDYTFTTLPVQYTLTITATNGAVTKEPDKTIYNAGETVTLTAVADSGYKFSNWQGDATGSVNPLSITMDANKSIEAMFVVDTSFVLISWALPTPDSGTIIKTGSQVSLNTSITYSLNTSAFFDWNSTLVEYLSFDNYTSGTQVPDLSSWANNAIIKGNPTIVDGKFGKGIQFDGIDDYLNIPDTGTSSLDVKQITIEAWINQTNNSTGQIIVNKELQCEIGINAGKFQGATHTGSWDWRGTQVIPLNTWTHVALVFDGKKQYYYINGELKESFDWSGTLSSNDNDLRIGARGGDGAASAFFAGIIDELRIHSRALSAQEIKSSYDAKVNGLSNTFSNITEGNYTFTAYAVNSLGNIAKTESRTVFVNNPPVANAGPDQLVIIGKSITFDASGSKDAGGIKLYEWDFNGDGVFEESGPGPTITHTFGQEFAGKEYSIVNLRVTDEYDVQGQDSLLIYPKAEQAPKITFIADNLADYASQGGVPKYEKFEVTFDVSTVATNYYWPYDPNPPANTPTHPNAVAAGVGVSVDGLFLPPGETDWNNAVVQPGFYYQDFERQIISNKDWIYPKGNSQWKIRFAPTLEGNWQYKIRVRDASGEAIYDSGGSFSVVSSSNHGFVKVSERDSRYFETSDGQNLNLIGLNDITTTPYAMDTRYPSLKQMGINFIRPWWQGAQGPVLFGVSWWEVGSLPEWGYSLKNNWIVYGQDVARPGELFSIKLTGSQSASNTVSVKPGKKYRYSAWIKTVGLTAGGDNGASISASSGYTSFTPSWTQKPSGDTGWREIYADITTGASQRELGLGINVKSTSGAAYFGAVSMREYLDDGSLGGEMISKPNMNAYQYVSQKQAWIADYQVELSKQLGIYLKVVVGEKHDPIYSRIQSDGTAGPQNDNNFYASSTSANRVYQQYYWRYLIARYGYSTAIHSWEFNNEGDPYNGNHYNAVESFGQYIRANDSNKHLVSSSNWHSFPAYMWTQPNVDYTDIHRYVGFGAYSGLYILWPGWDGAWFNSFYKTSSLGAGYEFDTTTAHSGRNSLKINIPQATGTVWASANLFFQVGVIPGHKYQISWWAKAEDIKHTTGVCSPSAPYISAYYAGVQTMWDGWPSWSVTGGNPCGKWKIPDGTYDWQEVKAQVFTVPTTLGRDTKQPIRYLGIGIGYLTSPDSPAGTAWFDDIEIKDVDTGQILNYNGGFEYIEPESYDVVAGHQAYSHLTRSFHFGKPTVRGEVGHVHPRTELPNPYKGYSSGDVFDRLIVDDIDGVWWRKWVWANTDPGGLIEMLWDCRRLLLDRNYKYGKAYQTFMSDIPLSNGHYQDINATVITPEPKDYAKLRVLGQKDIVANRAHLWIDNVPYTWKAVVDHNFNPTDIKWLSTVTYAKGSLASEPANPTVVYRSLQDSNKNHPLSDTTWWENRSSDWYTLLDMKEPNPPLPLPVSGTVTIPGLKDGNYKADWWDTSSGSIISTEDITCSGGNINLTVSNLISDVAVKIYPTEAPVNNPPDISAIPDTLTKNEGDTITKAEIEKATDPDGDTLTYTYSNWLTSLPYTITYSDSGTHTLHIEVSDGKASLGKDITITVKDVNRSPLADNQAVTLDEDTSKAITLSGSDADSDALTYAVVTNPAKGSLTGTAPNLTYTPTADYNGSDSFTFKVNDGTDDSNIATVSIIINPLNDAPELKPIGNQTIDENKTLTFEILANDIEGDVLTYRATGLPQGASFDTSTRTFSWTPDYTQAGSYALTFSVDDQKGGTDFETITITVNNVNRAPDISGIPDALTKDESQAITKEEIEKAVDPDADALSYTYSNWLTSLPHTITYSDAGTHTLHVDVSDGKDTKGKDIIITINNIAYSLIITTQNGSVTKNPDKTQYDPGEKVNLIASANPGYRFRGWSGDISGVTNPATLIMDTHKVIEAIFTANQAPVLEEIAPITVNEGETIILKPIARDADGDTVTLTYSGWITSNTYTTNYQDAGEHSVTITASDGELSVSQEVKITVNNVNQPPTAQAQSVVAPEDTAVRITLSGYDSDNDTLEYLIITYPAHGRLEPAGNEFIYTPQIDYSGEDEFMFKVNDGAIDSLPATVTITVTAVNDAPKLEPIGNQTIDEGKLLEFIVSAQDADNDTLIYSASNLPSGASFDATTHTFSWTPDYTQAGSYALTFSVDDQKGGIATETITITVNNVNRAPDISSIPDVLTKNESETITNAEIEKATDPDGDTLTYIYSGWLTSLPYTISYSDSGTHTLQIKVTDGIANQEKDIAITVNNVSRPPEFSQTTDSVTITENEQLTYKLPKVIRNYGSGLVYELKGKPDWVTFNEHSRNLIGKAPFTSQRSYELIWRTQDSEGSQDFVLTLNVLDKPRSPNFKQNSDSLALDEGQEINYTLYEADKDVDFPDDEVNYSLVSAPDFLTLDQAARRLKGTIPFDGKDRTYAVVAKATGLEGKATFNLSIQVKNVNRAPMIRPPLPDYTISEGQNLTFAIKVHDLDVEDTLVISLSGAPDGATFLNDTFNWRPNYTQSGIYLLTLTASDGDLKVSQDFKVTVIDATPPPEEPVSTPEPEVETPTPTLISAPTAVSEQSESESKVNTSGRVWIIVNQEQEEQRATKEKTQTPEREILSREPSTITSSTERIEEFRESASVLRYTPEPALYGKDRYISVAKRNYMAFNNKDGSIKEVFILDEYGNVLHSYTVKQNKRKTLISLIRNDKVRVFPTLDKKRVIKKLKIRPNKGVAFIQEIENEIRDIAIFMGYKF